MCASHWTSCRRCSLTPALHILETELSQCKLTLGTIHSTVLRRAPYSVERCSRRKTFWVCRAATNRIQTGWNYFRKTGSSLNCLIYSSFYLPLPCLPSCPLAGPPEARCLGCKRCRIRPCFVLKLLQKVWGILCSYINNDGSFPFNI